MPMPEHGPPPAPPPPPPGPEPEPPEVIDPPLPGERQPRIEPGLPGQVPVQRHRARCLAGGRRGAGRCAA